MILIVSLAFIILIMITMITLASTRKKGNSEGFTATNCDSLSASSFLIQTIVTSPITSILKASGVISMSFQPPRQPPTVEKMSWFKNSSLTCVPDITGAGPFATLAQCLA